MILTYEEVQGIVDRHFDSTVADEMVAICFAESGGEQYAVNDNYPRWQADPDSPYRYDYGLAQINSIHGFDAERLLADPDYNLGAARWIYDRQGLRAWSTYNSGAYLRFMFPTPVTPPLVDVPVIDRPRRLSVTNDADIQAWIVPLSNADFYSPSHFETVNGQRYAVYANVKVLLPQ